MPSTMTRKRYKRLAVLHEDVPASTPVLRALWGVDADEAESTVEFLVSRSLAVWGNEGLKFMTSNRTTSAVGTRHPMRCV